MPIGWPLPEGPWRRGATGEGLLHACQLQLDMRRFVNGHLQAIDLPRSSVRWLAAGRSEAIELPFTALRSLRLMALVPAEPADSPAWRPPPKAAPFRVVFTEGGVWSGLTFRVAGDGRGFFVCEPVDEIGNLRLSFVPRAAWRSLHIGAAHLPDAPAAAGMATGHDGAPKATIERAAAPRLGQVLIELGLIDAQQLQAALAAQRTNRGLALGEVLVRQGALRREDLARALAVKSGQPAETNG